MYGGTSFYQRKEIKDLIAYFKLTVNPRDDESLRRIINYPARGIGATTLDRLFLAAGEQNIGVFDLITFGEQPASIKNTAWKKVSDFAIMIQSFMTELETKSAHSLALHIAKRSGIVHQLYTDKQKEGNYNEGTERYENVQELLNGIHAFSDEDEESDRLLTLRDYLSENIELITDADQEEDDNNKVSLMTIHAAKGLEFKHVYVVGMEENLFPSQRSMDSRADMEEERRLFYVALTRACITCTLSYAQMRFKWGQMHMGEPSRFIDEIDEQYISTPTVGGAIKAAYGTGGGFTPGGWGATTRKPAKKTTASKPAYQPSILGRNLKKVNLNIQPSNASPSELKGLKEGAKVKHAKFGLGKVMAIEGTEPNIKATIKFAAVGTKQLLLKFAKLEIV